MSAKRKTNSISLKKVSELAGVTQCTASRILNRNPNYNYAKETVDRVFKIAAENGYRTSQLYKSLFSGKTKSAGVISPNTGFYSKIAKGIHDRLLENGYAIVMGINSKDYDDPENSTEKKIIHRLNEHRVDGFIMRPTLENATDEHFKEIIDMKVPLITIDRIVNSEYADYVGSDNINGGKIAARHLLNLGHTNIVQFAGNPSCSAFRERATGFEEELIENGCIPQQLTCDSLYDTTKKSNLVFSRDNYPTAVFCNNDSMAGEVYKTLHELGIRIPEDVSIIGFGDEIIGNYVTPQLTTIGQQPHLIGIKAAELFIQRLNDDPDQKHQRQKILVDVELIERESTCSKK